VTREIVRTEGTNLIGFLRQEQRTALDKDSRWSKLLAKTSPTRIHAGSLIKISYKTSTTSTRPTVFQGVLLATHRHPSEPTILVRANIDGVGVEQKFCVMSPLVEGIEVLRPATLLMKHKLYLLREQPALINKFSLPVEDQKRRLSQVRRGGKLHNPLANV